MKRKRGKPSRKSAKTRQTRTTVSRSRAANRVKGERQLEQAVGRLRSSVNLTVTRAEAIRTAAGDIASLAISQYRRQLLESLVEDGVLTSIDGLAGEVPADLRLTRQTIAGWLRRNVDLDSALEVGAVVEIPATSLKQMTVLGSRPEKGLARVKVREGGWRVAGKTLVP